MSTPPLEVYGLPKIRDLQRKTKKICYNTDLDRTDGPVLIWFLLISFAMLCARLNFLLQENSMCAQCQFFSLRVFFLFQIQQDSKM